jgi:hypothetical protein
MPNVVETALGGEQGIRETDGKVLYKIGEFAGPSGAAADGFVPGFQGGFCMEFNIAGTADTGGAILSWKNTLGYDIIVTQCVLDVITQSAGACTVSVGQTPTNGTTLASNLINGQSVAAAGVFNSGSNVVKVAKNTWLTGSRASGASAALVGRAYFYCVVAGAAAAT